MPTEGGTLRRVVSTAYVGSCIFVIGGCSGETPGPETPTGPTAPPPAPLPPPANPAVIAGRVIPADGGPLTGLRFFARHIGGTESVEIALDGTFEIRLGIEELAPGDSLDLWVDTVDPSARRYLPSLARIGGFDPEPARPPPPGSLFPPEDIPTDVRIVLIPDVWEIRSAGFPETSVPIRVVRALFPAEFAYYQSRGDGRAQPVSWPDSRLPIRVAIAHAQSNETITAEDSASLWSHLDDLERRVGIDLFRPAVWDGELESPGQIVFSINRGLDQGTDLVAAGIGGAHPVRWPRGPGDLDWGFVTLRNTALISMGLVQHEFLHALGFGHSCNWPSIMSGCGFGPREGEGATPEDVAYLLVKYRVRQLQRENSIRDTTGLGADVWGIEAARLGERVVLQGRSAYLNAP